MGERELIIEIQIKEGESFGATLNDKMFIIKVEAGTPSDGKLKIGDKIIKLNNTVIRNTNHFLELLRSAPPPVVIRLVVIRDEKAAEEILEASKVNNEIPAERSKNIIQRRDGFIYSMVKIQWKRGGPKLGLGLKHYQNNVLVSRCDDGSLAAQQLQIGDHIIDIDGKPVSDKDVAGELLLKSFKAQGFVTFVIERPESTEAKKWAQFALSATAQLPPSFVVNSDVREIAARERIRLKERNEQPKKPGILGPSQRSGRVQIGEKVSEHLIASDNERKTLRSVQKK